MGGVVEWALMTIFTCRRWVGCSSLFWTDLKVRDLSQSREKHMKSPSKQLKFQKSNPPQTHRQPYHQQCDYASLTWGGVRGKGLGDLVMQLK